jgi:hypothetical protein
VRFASTTYPCGLVPASDVNWLADLASKSARTFRMAR